MIGYVPSLFGVITSSFGCGNSSMYGKASIFCPNSGTQNEWTTSFDLSSSFTGRLIGRRRIGVVTPFAPPFAYVNVHANCSAVTFTCSGFDPALPFSESTTAAAMAITVTRSAGTAVQAISSPVWPWIGGPSVSSSGRARNFRTE